VFIYLAWRSTYNRVARQARQLRNPRYLAALAFGLTYLWIVAVDQRPERPPQILVGARWLELVGAIGVIGALLWGWIFGVERRVLAFSPAEVTFLFSGPVTRRGLVQYKLLRNQILILFNSLLWTLILARERFGASPWLRAISIWVLLTTISFHRLGASFVRTSLLEHGRSALRHRIVSLVLLGSLLIGVAWSIQDAFPDLAAGWTAGPTTFLDALTDASDRPLPRVLLAPFRAMVRPLAAHTLGDWVRAAGPALCLLVLHYIWVIRADAAFEEAAAEASLRRARLSTRAAATPSLAHRRLPALFRLAPLGWPAQAILWKNLLAVVRTRRARNTTAALAVAALLAGVLSFDAGGSVANVAGWLATTWAGLSIVIGPQWVRNDLRSDLLKLDLLRSYPLAGRAVLAAETAGSTAVLTALQVGLLLVAYFAFLGNAQMYPSLGLRTLALATAVACLPAINYLGLLIQNGAALLFPAWIHLGSGRPGGVEALGQNMLIIVAYSAVLAVGLALPGMLGLLAFALLRDSVGWWAIVPGVAVLLAGIAVEVAALLHWLGGVFESTDPAGAEIAA
jgi:hypothetical protein